MSRKIAAVLALLLSLGLWTVPVRAQTGEPPSTGTHVVRRGETLFSIARRYGLTVDAIAHANDVADPRRIYTGQRLAIPGPLTEVTPEETAPYVVQAGETLVSIAAHCRTAWQTLARLNRLVSPDVVYVGQVLRVPASETLARAGESERGRVHIVRSDDTLLRIGLRYGVPPCILAVDARIANSALMYPGQALAIPGEGSCLLPDPFVSIDVQPLPVTQGTTTVVTVRATEAVALEGQLFSQEVHFGEEGGAYYGLVGTPVLAEPNLYELELRAADAEGRTTELSADIVVEAGRFGYERIDVSSNLFDPAIVAAEQERFDALRSTFSGERRWSSSFQRPCAGTISSYFGTRRAYDGGPYTHYHSGVDFRAPVGTPVYASAAGTVMLAEPLAVRGNAIVIDHGWGVLTGYWHLSSIQVLAGEQVAPGDRIGKVGSTGLSTGPHLHWQVWVGGTSVDGLQWLESFHPWPERGQLSETTAR